MTQIENNPEPTTQPLHGGFISAKTGHALAGLGDARLRVLVVDDSPDNQFLVEIFLDKSIYQLTFEENGQAAVEQFTSAEFDLILMDINMPIMDGLTATRQIRAIEAERGSGRLPILALTSNNTDEDVELSMNAGCDAHLVKPISQFDLVKAIERHKID